MNVLARYLCFLSLQFLFFSTNFAQPKSIRYRNNEYSAILNRTPALNFTELIQKLQDEQVLDIYLFNRSYLQGIGDFIFFKNTFHQASGASDIPNDTSPLAYLLNVINRYEISGKYRVAFLYYDAAGFDDLEDLRRTDSLELPDPFANAGLSPAADRPPPDLNKFVRVWYLSNRNLAAWKSPGTYAYLNQLEEANRLNLHVSGIGEQKSPRGITPSDTNRNASVTLNINVALALRECLIPDRILNVMQSDSINALIVIPYGVIGQIPFHLLPLNQDSTLLVDKYAYTIAPHLCNFAKVFSANKGKIGKANFLSTISPLVVGNPSFYKSGSVILPDLPGAEAEVNQVAKLLNTTAVTGAQANFDNITSRLSRSDFAYFATHAVPSFDDPATGSFIALTPSQNNKTGFLTIRKIQSLGIKNTKLVVLSACQTGVGKAYKNGYCNIGRGFFIAGVDNCIMSLWNLDDQNIIPLMTALVEELHKPQMFYPAENLRQAILKFRKINRDPAYWSAIVNFGICY